MKDKLQKTKDLVDKIAQQRKEARETHVEAGKALEDANRRKHNVDIQRCINELLEASKKLADSEVEYDRALDAMEKIENSLKSKGRNITATGDQSFWVTKF